MRKNSKATIFETLLANKRLRTTPLCVGFTLLTSGFGAAYYTFYTREKSYKNTQIYKEAFQHLSNYEAVNKHVGDKWRVSWVKEAVIEENTVMLVVPFEGARGKANLIIHGKKSDSDEAKLDSLDIELKSPPKKWTFYRS